MLSALQAAGIQNVNADLITQYVTDIAGATTPESLADVQTIIDKTNADNLTASQKADIVKAVADAETQVQLLNVLQANFDRVNADWITNYQATSVATATGTDTLLGLDTANYAGESAATTVEDIQTAIDAENSAQISSLDGAAATVAEQTEVTNLINSYVADDVAPATTKATAVKDSQIKTAAFKVAESTTQNSLYSNLVAYANITPDATLKASELNDKLKADYMTALTTKTKATLVTEIQGGSDDIKASIVGAADTAALNAALLVIDGLDSTNTSTEVKAALQKLADVTAHEALAADKFDISTVLDAKLLNYVTLAVNGFDAATINSISLVNSAITAVNATVEEAAALDVISSSTSTTTQVRDALIQLALANSNTTTDAYVNASSQVKLEVAQFVVDNRSSLESPLTVTTVTANSAAAYNTAAIGKATADHQAKLDEFNAIGDLVNVGTTVTTSTTKSALDTYAYAPYVALNATQKLAVAEEINTLVHVNATTGVETPYDFTTGTGADEVTTLKAANDIIAAAITASAN